MATVSGTLNQTAGATGSRSYIEAMRREFVDVHHTIENFDVAEYSTRQRHAAKLLRLLH